MDQKVGRIQNNRQMYTKERLLTELGPPSLVMPIARDNLCYVAEELSQRSPLPLKTTFYRVYVFYLSTDGRLAEIKILRQKHKLPISSAQTPYVDPRKEFFLSLGRIDVLRSTPLGGPKPKATS